jgi:type I restriction-modification system DNA methylase subunit/REP element-mobilizing transposase RayT
MKFFQNSVLHKHQQAQDHESIRSAWQKFTAYFHHPEIQQNIREAKEEQFQEGFLRELFVGVLGYVLNPSPNYNLTTELKNEKGAKKADGAIYAREHAPLHNKVLAVIELKGTDTKDLDKINVQAFNYKNNHPGCVYVITSNFEKLRFFIHHSVDYLEFNLFTLTETEFSLLWLCLAAENLLNGMPLKVKEDSLVEEEKVTKQLYKDYSAFRTDLWQNMVKNSPEADRLLLFKKTQKLLDRYLFILFAEDSGLLPPNSVSQILKRWEVLKDEDAYKPLYKIFNQYFGYINTGRKGKTPEGDIFAYNGGLFLPDEVLDHVVIDDEVLYIHVSKLTKYDFQSEVDVNILGHIFENSLTEIENITAELEGQELDKSKTKRKKDGVFYTPKYITKYIVENTLGKLCDEKKAELEIVDEEYAKGRRNRKKETVKKLADNLQAYRNWLLGLTICDPACGSGAFLNQALEFLIEEHTYIDELHAQLFGASIVFQDISNHILEQNIYGVDINEESVDIAKLSLWLRTAQRGRKLTTLNNNIKCGNSLIDDPAVAGDKAFNWQKEFPNVFRLKEKKAWHVTTATHNSRYSQRMFENHVTLGDPVWLTSEEERIVTQTIAEIVAKDSLNVLAYNICGDHMHLLLVCEEEELPAIVGKLKSMSARAANIAMGRTRVHAPSAESTLSLSGVPSADSTDAQEPAPASEYSNGESAMEWVNDDGDSGGYGFRGTTQAHLWTQKFGRKLITSDEQLWNTIEYIRNNRAKHGLPDDGSEGACSLASVVVSVEYAFRPEYTGGFDVVIGNPPYVQLQSMGEMSDKLSACGYESFHKGADLYCIFTERGYQLLKKGGIQSFIMPNKWMLVEYGKPLRKFLSKTGLQQILNFGDIQFFQEATTYVCIFVTQKTTPADEVKVLSLNRKTYHGDFLSEVKSNSYPDKTSKFGEVEWSIQPLHDARKLEQMKLSGIELKDLPVSIYRGILTGYNDAFYIDEETRQNLIAADARSAELIKPMVRGRDIAAYEITGFEYLIGTFPSLKLDIEDYPAIKAHLLSFGYDRLKQTGESGARKKTSGKWFETQDSIAYHEDFAKPKIIYPNMTSVFPFKYDESGLLSNDKSFILTALNDSVSLLFLTAVFNSSAAKLWIWYNCPELQGGTREIRKVYFEHFPVPQANPEQTTQLAQLATNRARATGELQRLDAKFERTLHRKFPLTREHAPLSLLSGHAPSSLRSGYAPLSNLLSYAEFVAELRKKKVKLSLSDEAEWEEYFLQEQQKALDLKATIEATEWFTSCTASLPTKYRL